MLLVIGDSHAVIWGGRLIVRESESRSLFPNLSIRYLGAPLAYNLVVETKTGFGPGKWGAEVLKQVRQTPGTTAICLSFGEIDLRTRAVKVAMDTGIPLAASVAQIADRLIVFCRLLKDEFAHPIFVAAPVPTMHGGSWDSIYPAYGSERERNAATRMFVDYLSAKSGELRSFHVVSVFDQLVDSTLRARTEFFADTIHLNTKGLDLLIAEFRRIVRERDLPLIDFWDPASLLSESSLREISKEIALNLDAQGQTNAIQLDLGYGTFPRRLKLEFKFDQPRLSFTLSGGVSKQRLAPIGTYETAAPRIEIEFPESYSCRFLQITVEASVKVSLEDIKLVVRSFLRP
jgi:hypothetical protein